MNVFVRIASSRPSKDFGRFEVLRSLKKSPPDLELKGYQIQIYINKCTSNIISKGTYNTAISVLVQGTRDGFKKIATIKFISADMIRRLSRIER